MPDDLSDAEWLEKLRGIGERDGYFSTLGPDHASIFVERSHDVLFVAFETLFGIRSVSDTGLPVAFDVCGRRGWSHLSLITKKQTWFRDKRVWNYFDRLVDYGFFEDFDRVIFYGAGMCGYAAAAFSVTAPGAEVILVSPQATLERTLAGWESRFPTARRLDFSTRYAYAPDMLEAAAQAHIIYDPDETEDAMHASLFRGQNVNHQRYRRGRAGAIESDLRALGLVSIMAEKAAMGMLTPGKLASILKLRKRHVPYLRALLARVLAEDRPALTAMLCRAVLADRPIPRFKHHLEVAERRLAAERDRDGTVTSETQDSA
jgi:hypothetical protein